MERAVNRVNSFRSAPSSVPNPSPLQACRTNPSEKGKFIKTILLLLQSPSPAVMYECAVTLTSLSAAPSAVRAAANCFCSLLSTHSDNNVKLIVLDRLQELKEKHREVGCALTINDELGFGTGGKELQLAALQLPRVAWGLSAQQGRHDAKPCAHPAIHALSECVEVACATRGLTVHVLPGRCPPQVMTDMVMDTLRALASPSLDIRKKTLDISLELITSRNIDEVGS